MPSKDAERILHLQPARGRGALSNRASRFLADTRETDADFIDAVMADDRTPQFPTELRRVCATSILSRNESPDIGFDRSVNPYQGCEHGCVYCYARPTHAYLGLSPGLDFETRLVAKTNAAELLRQTLSSPRYEARLLALGANTDPYQPVEKVEKITRAVLQVLSDFNHPVAITTKSALVTRDIDLLAPMAAQGLARVAISIATDDPDIARRLEPRANTPERRFRAIGELTAAGIPTSVIVAPVIPALTDRSIEQVIGRAREEGADSAWYVILRLPLEIRELFQEWLARHFPDRAAHVMSLVRQMRGGKDYDAQFLTRMKGTGVFADLIAQRFHKACERAGMQPDRQDLTTALFRAPPAASAQGELF